MGDAGAVLVLVAVYAASVAVVLMISIYVLRRGVDPLRAELTRIADVLELQAELELAEDEPQA